MRTREIEIDGKKYWLTFSARSQMGMEALKKDGVTPRDEPTKWFFTLLIEELRAGYRWATRHGWPDANQPPKEEDLEDMLDMDDLGGLTPILLEIMQGERNVVAKPPKKEEAGAEPASEH